MSKIYMVARREYMENLRTKAFWIGILAFPLIITLSVLVPTLLSEAKAARTYVVLDHSGFLLEEVEAQVIERDLRQVFAAVQEKRRRGESVAAVLERLDTVLGELDEGERATFISLLAASQSAPREEIQLPEKARVALRDQRVELQEWWRRVSVRELDRLKVELSRSLYVRVDIPSAAGEDPQVVLNRMINNSELFAYFVIGADPVESSVDCKYISNNLTDRGLLNWFSNMAAEAVRKRRIAREDIDPHIARWIQESLTFQGRKVGQSGAEEEVESRDMVRQWAPVAFVYLLWIAIFTSAQMLLTNTVEEKSNRIIEVLLSSISPFQLMAGKIAGMAASGLTVVGSWAVCIFTILVIVPGAMGAPANFLGNIAADPVYILSFLLYFLMGYLFYASILAGIGSVCNSVKETQNLMMPVLIPMLIPLLAMVPIGQDPNGLLARVLSFIPPFTPFVMMNRAAGPPALWEYGLTTLLMVGAIIVTVRGSARVFRIGILMTGKPPRLREIIKWMTLREGVMPASGKED
jgi:ABC-2 type transport system permease protein